MDKLSTQRMAEALLLLSFTPEELAALTPGEIRLLAAQQRAAIASTSAPEPARAVGSKRVHMQAAIQAFAALPVPSQPDAPATAEPDVIRPSDDPDAS
ncbi:MAG: hypothetical protein ACLFVO_25915 [Chloroflexaceae bacterium]